VTAETNHLTAGIKLQLNGTLEKFSPALNRNAVYNKVSKIARLPAYLSVQYLRFYWKAAAKTNAKVLRVCCPGRVGSDQLRPGPRIAQCMNDAALVRWLVQNVKFPLTLDMYEFCTEELRQKLTPMRKRFEAQAQREVDERVCVLDGGAGHIIIGAEVLTRDLAAPCLGAGQAEGSGEGQGRGGREESEAGV
jgi:ubiquitin carboxyl-terminal hydrolase 14